jgi:diguanylate cyclase (GGDEF)-like protein
MSAGLVRRRVLVVGRGDQCEALCSFASGSGWGAVAVDSFARATFQLTGWACEVITVHDSLVGPDWHEGLAWLSGQVSAPLVLVASFGEDMVLDGLRHGMLWLSPEVVWRCPAVLGALLDQAHLLGQERQQAARARTALAESQAHVDRLLGMLWEAAPLDGPTRWFTQRHMLERLEEEVERSRRFGAPLTVVLGALAAARGQVLDREQSHELAGWLAGRVGQNKRRCDVAGQYGGHGFVMVLPQTSSRHAIGACTRLRDVLARPPHTLGAVHACFGLASLPEEQASVPALLRRAEERLDRARASPHGGVVAD